MLCVRWMHFWWNCDMLARCFEVFRITQIESCSHNRYFPWKNISCTIQFRKLPMRTRHWRQLCYKTMQFSWILLSFGWNEGFVPASILFWTFLEHKQSQSSRDWERSTTNDLSYPHLWHLYIFHVTITLLSTQSGRHLCMSSDLIWMIHLMILHGRLIIHSD